MIGFNSMKYDESHYGLMLVTTWPSKIQTEVTFAVAFSCA
jgi:hypothetical protein